MDGGRAPEGMSAPVAGGSTVLRFRSTFGDRSLEDKVGLLVVGILPAAICLGLAILLFMTEGAGALAWDDWLTLTTVGVLFLTFAITDAAPGTIAMDDEAIRIQDLWNTTRIASRSVQHVYLARKRGRLLVALGTSSGSVLQVADGVPESAKSALIDRLRQRIPAYESLVTEVEPREFGYVLSRRGRLLPEVRRRWTSYAAAILALVFVAVGLGAIGVVAAVKGYAAVTVVIAILGPALVLAVLGAVTRHEAFFDGAIALTGVATTFWGAYPIAAMPLGLDPLASPSSIWFAPPVLALGVGILFWALSRARRRRGPGAR